MESDIVPYDTLVRLRLLIGNRRLEDARKEAGFSMVSLAEETNIKYWRILSIANLRRIPTEDEIIKISVALKKPIDYLFPENLFNAIKAGVFDKRISELTETQVEVIEERHRESISYDGGIGAIIEEVDRKLLSDSLDKSLCTLKPKEERVLRLRYGFVDGESKTMEQVGKEFNVGRARIQQIEAKALRKLRHPMRKKRLEGFY